MKQILRGEKKLIKNEDIKCINMPKYDELSVKNLYSKFAEYPHFLDYFPDSFPKGWTPDRDYVMKIYNTLYKEEMKELKRYALAKRYLVEDEEQ